jgi:hypothetical protein
MRERKRDEWERIRIRGKLRDGERKGKRGKETDEGGGVG